MENIKRSVKILKEKQEPLKFSNVEPLEVIEPYRPQIIQFESIEDFNSYYSKHQNEFNETTQKLNKKYKIPGYKFTSLKGTLKIIKDYQLKDSSESSLEETPQEREYMKCLVKNLEEKIKNQQNMINELQKQIVEIQNYLQSL